MNGLSDPTGPISAQLFPTSNASLETCRMNATRRVQLIDWGQSGTADEGKVLNGKAWQFYRPHPPERVLQLPASYPMDVWGIGIVTVNMLTGSLAPAMLYCRPSQAVE